MGVDGPLAGQPDISPAVLFAFRVVVVAVDAVDLYLDGRGVDVCAYPVGEGVAEAVHHFGPVGQGESLGPVQLAQVRLEFRSSLGKVGEVEVREVYPPLLAECLGGLEVLFGDLVADASGA